MKNGLQDIISSGIAPGLRPSTPAVDPESCFAKVPKAFREIERGERRSKRGTGAREISKLFGMSVDTIKRGWNMSCIAFLLLLGCSSFAGVDLTTGETFVDGQTVHASDLNSAINNASIQATFISAKGAYPTQPTGAEQTLLYNNNLLYRIPLSVLILGNTNLIAGQLLKAAPTNQDLLLILDNATGAFAQTTINDLFNTGLFQFTNSSLTAWFDYTYLNLTATNLPSATNYLNDDFFWLAHDTNAPGNHTNYTGQKLTAAGWYTNQNAATFPLFSASYNNQGFTNGYGISTGTVLTVYSPISTNGYVPTPVVSNGAAIYQPTNIVVNTNTTVEQVSLLQLFNLYKALNPTVLFTSTNYPIPAAAGIVVIPHGFNATPSSVRPKLVCMTNDAGTGYVVGDELDFSEAGQNGAGHTAALFWFCDSNYIYIQNIVAPSTLELVNTNAASGFGPPTKYGSFLYKVYANP